MSCSGGEAANGELGAAAAGVEDPTANIWLRLRDEAPAARRPAPPTAASRGLLQGTPRVEDCGRELEELQATGRALQEAAGAGKRLCQVALSQLHGAQLEAAKATLQAIAELQTPRQVIGEEAWADPLRRLRLCDGNQVGWFIQSHICCLSLMSFFDRGVLSPDVPESCSVGVDGQDDEHYLTGVLDAVRELERYAVNRGQALDLESIQCCLAAVECVHHALEQFDFRNSELRRRFDGVKYAVRKLGELSYEVSLARQRAAATALAASQAGSATAVSAGAGDAAGSAAVTPTVASAVAATGEAATPNADAVRALDVDVFRAIKERYDRFDETRESVIKRSRDVIKAAKNAVYELQRGRDAGSYLSKCARDASAIYKDHLAEYPNLRNGIFSASLEELAEALALRGYLRDRCILGRGELQAQSGLSFPMALHEYLGGLMDLTGEVGRLAIKAAAKGRGAVAEVERHLEGVDAVNTFLRELPYLPHGLGKKMGGIRSTTSKIEGALYQLALLSQGLRVQAPQARDEDEGSGDEGGQGAAAGASKM